jgi:hypothetical protein
MPSTIKTLVLASTALMLSYGGGIAQTAQPAAAANPARTMQSNPPSTAMLPSERGVVGLSIRGPGDKTVGKIDNVIVAPEGKVKAFVVDVGGILGVGGKDVLVQVSDINFADGDREATTVLSEDELKAMPEYRTASSSDSTSTSRSLPPTPAGTPPSGAKQ